MKDLKEPTGAEALIQMLVKETEKKKFHKVEVEKGETDKIIVPSGMTYDEAIEWMKRKKDMEERQISINHEIRCYPLDGAYALFRAAEDIFGFADMQGEKSPSGENPPKMISITLPNKDVISVPWGQIQFPGFGEDDYIETAFNAKEFKFVIQGRIKRKFQDMVNKLVARTMDIVKTDSIYKGRTIRVDLSFMNKGSQPKQPEFLDVSDMTDEKIIMSKTAKVEYSGVLMRLEQTRKCVENNIPLKYGCLMAGPYGTGKTLTARWTANKANANGFTFIYLEDCRQLHHAIRLAEVYSPAVVFSEDIDKAVEGSRSVQMNDILNTLDGIDTKTTPVITILTTNHIENINKAFLRAGRIDKLIQMGPLDEETGLEFLKKFAKDNKGNSLLNTKQYPDFSEAGKSLSDIVPAFASEVIQTAKISAMARGTNDDKLIPDDIIGAAKSFKNHIALTEGKKKLTDVEKVVVLKRKLAELEGSDAYKEQLAGMEDNLERVKDDVIWLVDQH